MSPKRRAILIPRRLQAALETERSGNFAGENQNKGSREPSGSQNKNPPTKKRDWKPRGQTVTTA
jgi:hypothetical protein